MIYCLRMTSMRCLLMLTKLMRKWRKKMKNLKNKWLIQCKVMIRSFILRKLHFCLSLSPWSKNQSLVMAKVISLKTTILEAWCQWVQRRALRTRNLRSLLVIIKSYSLCINRLQRGKMQKGSCRKTLSLLVQILQKEIQTMCSTWRTHLQGSSWAEFCLQSQETS